MGQYLSISGGAQDTGLGTGKLHEAIQGNDISLICDLLEAGTSVSISTD